MNNVNIIGNLTKDVELKYTQNNKAVTTVTVAVNDGYGDNQKTYFIDVQVWEKQAENLHKYCGKGSKIAVSGKLVQQSWEHEGKKLSKVLIQATNVSFLDTKKSEAQSGQAPKEENEQVVEANNMQDGEDPFANFQAENEDELNNLELPF